MYGIVPILRDDERIGMAEWSVWAALCTFAKWERDKNGLPTISKEFSCFPSRRLIAEHAHTSVTTVLRALRNLRDVGYVSWAKDAGRTNMYTLNACPPV